MRQLSKTAQVSLLAAPILLTPATGQPASSVAQILNEFYDGYDARNGCWRALADDPQAYYCFKIDRTDRLQSDTGPRIYVLLTGQILDQSGETAGTHVESGLVGALVLSEAESGLEIIASEPRIPMGSFGSSPTEWKLVKLGPSDYWGWLNSTWDAHGGFSGSRYSLLAPYGRHIQELAGFVGSYSDEGTCTNEHACRATTLDSKLEIDSSQASEKVFPLKITVTGKIDGKVIAPSTWTLPFDSKTWSFIEPGNWPLAERDF